MKLGQLMNTFLTGNKYFSEVFFFKNRADF